MMQGIHIDTKAIAEGILGMVDDLDSPENYRAAMAFGMLPAPLMECLDTALKDKVGAIIEEKIGKRPSEPGTARECWDYLWQETAEWRKDFVKDCTREVTLAMYGMIKMVV